MIALRKAGRGDAPAIQRIYEQDIRGKARLFYSPHVIQQWAGKSPRYFEDIIATSPLCLIAQIGKCVVGFAAIEAPDTIAHVYVDPVWSGVGVGSTLLACLEQRIQETQGLVKVNVPLNAVSFFQRMGYETAGGPMVTHLAPQARFVCYAMEKKLGSDAFRRALNAVQTMTERVDKVTSSGGV